MQAVRRDPNAAKEEAVKELQEEMLRNTSNREKNADRAEKRLK